MASERGKDSVVKDRLSVALASLRSAFLTVGLFSLFINLAMLISPLYMMQVYDRVLTSQSLETLVALTVVVIVLLLITALVEVARSRLLVRISARLDSDVAQGLFGSAFMARIKGQEQAASQPLRDLDSLRTFLTGAGIIALFDAPWTPIYLAIIFMLHPVLGVIALVGAIVIFALALLSEMAVRAPMQEAGSGSRASSDFTDLLSRNAEAVHVMGMLGGLTRRWERLHQHGVAWQAIASDRLGVLQALAKTVRMGLQVAMLCAGAWLVLDHAMTAGSMMASSIIMGRALAPIEAAIANWRGFVSARQARRRLKQVTSEVGVPGGAVTRLPAPDGHVAVSQLTYRIESLKAPVLQNVSFELKAGESLGLVGPSGAGKSTLARLLVGMFTPSFGTVRLDGVDMAQWPKDEVGPYIGYLPQDVSLLAGTVAENICRFGEPDSEAIVAAAKLAGAHELILSLSQGYETPVGEAGRVLSGGQRQRIALARAVYGEVRLVVLDEPNANLDSEGEDALRRTLALLRDHRRTVIVITHKPSLLASVDKLMVLREGRVDRYGPREQVMAELQRPAVVRPPATAEQQQGLRRAGQGT